MKKYLIFTLMVFLFNTLSLKSVAYAYFITVKKNVIENKLSAEQNVYKGFEYLYNYQFEKADSVAKIFSSEKNKAPICLIYEMNYYWWLIVTGEDNLINRNKLKASSDTILAYYHRTVIKKKSTYDLKYYAVMAHAYKARLELLDKNYFAAVSNLNSCMHVLKTTFGKEEEYNWFYITSGLYNYFIEWGKQNYKVLAGYTLLYPKGNIKTGLNQLEKSSKHKDPVLSTEGLYFYARVNLDEEKKFVVAEAAILELKKRYPQNMLYQYLYFKLFLESERLDAAKEQYKVLNIIGLSNKSITPKQKQHFSSVAKKDLEEYYKKHPVK